jgi:hypothetical protein
MAVEPKARKEDSQSPNNIISPGALERPNRVPHNPSAINENRIAYSSPAFHDMAAEYVARDVAGDDCSIDHYRIAKRLNNLNSLQLKGLSARKSENLKHSVLRKPCRPQPQRHAPIDGTQQDAWPHESL